MDIDIIGVKETHEFGPTRILGCTNLDLRIKKVHVNSNAKRRME